MMKQRENLTGRMAMIVLAFFCIQTVSAQADSERVNINNWTSHFQATVIGQSHSGFPSAYRGENSLADSVEPTAVSLTSTLFLGRRLWKGAAIYVDPEVAGGKGLSFATGVAGALNGETYRVGATEPQVFIARAYLQQHIPLRNTKYDSISDGLNQLADRIPTDRVTISVGKFAISDFFDYNSYGKDPRTQFFNWSIWANGAWDYPADTRGYTYGIVAELIKPAWAIRISSVAVPRIANYHLLEYKIPEAHSETLEFEHKISINKRKGNLQLIFSNTRSKAPSYKDGINAIATNDNFLLDVIAGDAENNAYGGKKFGLGFNIEQELTNDIGFFSRVGWNDGKYASWAFTEIDQTFTAGLSVKGNWWKRGEDVFGFAFANNGISSGHRNFLNDGVYGFIIGDGKLNYGHETIIESYYNAKLLKFLWLSFDYQFVKNPGYNKDRGPLHVFGLRGHVQI
jgi:high affinity Mn2+ porin